MDRLFLQNFLEGTIVGIIPGCAVDCKFHCLESAGEVGQNIKKGTCDHFGGIAECTAAKSAQNQNLGTMDGGYRQDFAGALQVQCANLFTGQLNWSAAPWIHVVAGLRAQIGRCTGDYIHRVDLAFGQLLGRICVGLNYQNIRRVDARICISDVVSTAMHLVVALPELITQQARV